ncbi:MAG TPA: transcriptional regulator [Mycobacteriales bacterium]|nr:transcriptional regulator [Mycobacteriales bacterium]
MTDDLSHPTADFDDAVHQPTRLAILVVLHEAGRADFGYLKRTLDLTDGNLGRHLESLEGNGLIELAKGFEGRRPRTWAKLTPRGKRALDDELSAMRTLLKRFDR